MLAMEFTKRPKLGVAEEKPDTKWSLERLSKYISGQQNILVSFERRMAVHTYRLGQALTIARQKTPHGKWSQFLVGVGLSVATDNRARAVFSHFQDDEASLMRLTISEAYQLAGVSLGKSDGPSEPAADVPSENTVGNELNGDEESPAADSGSEELAAGNDNADGKDDADDTDSADTDSTGSENTEDGSSAAESKDLGESSQGASDTAKKVKRKPPAKENPNSPFRLLARVLTLSRFIAAAPLQEDDADHCLQLISEIEQVLVEIKTSLGLSCDKESE